MGIIKKQALQSSIINFIGIGFGSISRLSMPFVLTPGQIGIVELLNSISGMFIVLFNMGYGLILKKLFPKYRDEKNGHSGFLVLGFMLSFVGIGLAILTFYLGEDYFLNNKETDTPIIKQYAFLIPILIFFRIIFLNVDSYVRILYKTVIGAFLDSFLTKISLLILLILFAKSIVFYENFVYLYAFIMALPGIVIIIYAFFNTKKITLPKKDLFSQQNKMKSLILFGILSGSSYSIVQYVDIMMIYKVLPEKPEDYVAVYSVMLFASMLIVIPAKSLNKISSVVLAESWKDNDLKNIEDIYKRSCNNLLIIGGYLFIIGWSCIDEALSFLPEYQIGKYVFFFLGLGRVVELATGVNTDVIETSEKYKFNTYFNVILAVLVIIFNFIFITYFGIVGAALATLIGIVVINLFKALLLKRSFGFEVFDFNFWKTGMVVAGFVILISVMDYSAHPLLKIGINFVVLSAVFWFTILKLNLSEDITESVNRLRARFRF